MRTPLAWKNLTSQPKRFFFGVTGVCFAAVLMFMQNGFRNALLDSPIQILRLFEGDLIATSPLRYAIPTEKRFLRTLLERAASDAEVVWAEPMLIERAAARIRVAGHAQRTIRVIAVPLKPSLFASPALIAQLPLLETRGTALVDVRSKPQYGFALSNPEQLPLQSIELLNRKLKVLGTIDLGTDFAHDGNLLTSPETFAAYFPFRGKGQPLAVIDFGLIRLREGADPLAVAARLTALAPDQWQVMPRANLIAKEKQFWGQTTPIGIIFLTGTIMGFAVGVIICYQILFTNIHDSMSELATLKAMGYPNRFFLRFVTGQSLYLSILGFLPAWGLTWLLFRGIEAWVGLPMELNASRILLILGCTVAMCLLSGLLALRKLLSADPATLF